MAATRRASGAARSRRHRLGRQEDDGSSAWPGPAAGPRDRRPIHAGIIHLEDDGVWAMRDSASSASGPERVLDTVETPGLPQRQRATIRVSFLVVDEQDIIRLSDPRRLA